MKKIYVASSWRNPFQPDVVRLLRLIGHDVYDFRNPIPGDNGFSWKEIDLDWRTWSPHAYRVALQSPIAKRGFDHDMDALRAADVTILVLPCGRSAHLELGYALGAGQKTCLYVPDDCPTFEPELMVRGCDEFVIGEAEFHEYASRL